MCVICSQIIICHPQCTNLGSQNWCLTCPNLYQRSCVRREVEHDLIHSSELEDFLITHRSQYQDRETPPAPPRCSPLASRKDEAAPNLPAINIHSLMANKQASSRTLYQNAHKRVSPKVNQMVCIG